MPTEPNEAKWIGTRPASDQRPATANQDQVNVGTSSTSILAANANRNSFLIMNISTTEVYVYLGATATTSNGIKLKEGAAIYGDCYTGAITGITAGDTAKVSYIEV